MYIVQWCKTILCAWNNHSHVLIKWLYCSGTGDLNDILEEIEVTSSKICKLIDKGEKWYKHACKILNVLNVVYSLSPFEEGGGAYSFAAVRLSVWLSVGRSVSQSVGPPTVSFYILRRG